MFLHVLRGTLILALLFASVSGQCTAPRVRKEWRRLSPGERASWISAVNCLAKLPHDPKITPTVDPAISLIPPLTTNSSYFDDFSYAHMDLNVLIHNTGLFFPWHRMYVQTFEDALRTKCGYEGTSPYWDWRLDAENFYNATIWDESTYDGLGTWGDPNNDYQIFDGGLKDIRVAYPVPHNIRRKYTLQPLLNKVTTTTNVPAVDDFALKMNTRFTKWIIEGILNTEAGDYHGFQAWTENFNGPHTPIHLIVGGDLGVTCPFGLGPPECYSGPKWAPNDPIFFLHHAMIDRIWYEWQHKDPRNKNAFGGGSVSWQVNSSLVFAEYPTGAPPLLTTDSLMPGDGFWEDVPISDVMDTVGGRLCYIYA